MPAVDNAKLIRNKLLDFKEPGDFYVFHVIQRAKDKRANGTLRPGDTRDEGQRLIKTWYVDSLDYFDRKLQLMKEIADANYARLYFLPQVRNRLTVNRVLAKAIIDAIDDDHLRYDHLVRTAVCGCHASREKRWILDVDDDIFAGDHEKSKDLAEALEKDVLSWWQACPGKEKEKPFTLIYETRNGWGVLTKPFDVRILPSPSFLLKDAMMLAYCGI